MDEKTKDLLKQLKEKGVHDKPSLEFGAAIKRDVEGCWIVVHGWLSENHFPVSQYVVNTGETEQERNKVKTTLQQYFTGTGHALRGLLGILKGDPEVMNREFDMAIKANPQDRDIEACLAELKQEIKDLVEAVERTPGNTTLRSRLAKRYLLVQDYERASEQYSNFLKLDAHNAPAWVNLGFCYRKLEQFEKAIGALQKAIECDAGMVPAYINLAEVYERLGNLRAAVQNYEKAISLSGLGQRVILYDKLARAYFMHKEYNLALGTLDKALKLVGNDPKLRGYLLNQRELVMRAARGEQP